MENQLTLAKDLFFLEDKSLGRKKFYIIGSIERQISIRVSSVQYKIIQFIYNTLKEQQLSDEEIEKMILDKLAYKINIGELKSYLDDMGLMENSQSRLETSEVKMMGVHLYSTNINEMPSFLIKASKALSFTRWLEPILVLVSLVMILVNLDAVILSSRNHFFTYNKSSIQGALMSMAVSMVVIAIHEIAHVLEAVRQNMSRLDFSVALYAGFIPMYYTQYPEMIALDRKRKIAILSAGLRTNIVMAAISLAIMGFTGIPEKLLDLCGIIFLVNFHFILINISPFLMNDGYFMLMNLLGINGLRTKMWQYLRNIIKKRDAKIPDKNRLLFFLYLISSLSIMGVNLYITITWVYKVIKEIILLI